MVVVLAASGTGRTCCGRWTQTRQRQQFLEGITGAVIADIVVLVFVACSSSASARALSRYRPFVGGIPLLSTAAIPPACSTARWPDRLGLFFAGRHLPLVPLLIWWWPAKQLFPNLPILVWSLIGKIMG